VFSTKIFDHGGRRSNTAHALVQWRHPVPVASTSDSEAWDVLHEAMHPASYRCIRSMVIKIASKVGVFFCIVDFIVIHNQR